MLVLGGGRWSKPCPRQFTHKKETGYPLCRRLVEPQGQSGWVQKISVPLGFDSQTIKYIASCYNNYTIPAHFCKVWYIVNGCHSKEFLSSWLSVPWLRKSPFYRTQCSILHNSLYLDSLLRQLIHPAPLYAVSYSVDMCLIILHVSYFNEYFCLP
jgi:hypothetical protein